MNPLSLNDLGKNGRRELNCVRIKIQKVSPRYGLYIIKRFAAHESRTRSKNIRSIVCSHVSKSTVSSSPYATVIYEPTSVS